MARVLAFESRSFIVRRYSVRHSVMRMVNAMYTASAPAVMAMNVQS